MGSKLPFLTGSLYNYLNLAGIEWVRQWHHLKVTSMCGIAGVFGEANLALVEDMLSSLVHRGPDDGYIVYDQSFTLGARRLSIVGIETGRQPLSNESGSVWAAQNGELYNYPEVKEELLSKGHKLRSQCDTEILPHLYEDHGPTFVKKIDGMFAVAIWDSTNKLGVLARDRMGKKPLYYANIRGRLYFASEIKALLRIPGFERKVNLEALHHYLSFKHVPCPLTIFEGIKSVPPAHYLIFHQGQVSAPIRYWDVSYQPAEEWASASEGELVDEFVRLFEAGIQKRLMSDVPVGFFLSGGIDSSLCTAIAAEHSNVPIETFTLTYKNNSTTEGKELDRYWASWTADKYKTEHHEEQVEFSQFPENLQRIIQCFDEPFCGTISTYFLAPLISKHVKVAMSGDAADELFGSYLSHRLAFPLANYQEYLSSGNEALVRPFEGRPEYLKQMFETADWDWRSKLFVLSDDAKASLYSASIMKQMSGFNSRTRLETDFSTLTAIDPLNRILEAEFKTIFADQVLTFIDRLSMAHSLEVRTAYLDTALVNFVAGIPGHYKIRNGETKYLLKQVALRYFPKEMVSRKKEGFVMPLTDWLLGDLQEYVRATLAPERLAVHGLFNCQSVQSLVDNLYQKESDYTEVNKVFSLLVFQQWYEMYIGGCDGPSLLPSVRIDIPSQNVGLVS